jgi:hypothetical protein
MVMIILVLYQKTERQKLKGKNKLEIKELGF